VIAYLEKNSKDKLLMAQTRLAPIKNNTTPRLELRVAVLGVMWDQSIRKSVDKDVKISFNFDLKVLITRIQAGGKYWKQFLGKRVYFINNNTKNED
jgi:Pao retrotransposon peptidase